VRSIVQLSSDDEFVENDVEFVKFLWSVACGFEFVKFFTLRMSGHIPLLAKHDC
jgi:hypothetical protein